MQRWDEFRQIHDFPCWCGEKSSKIVCAQGFGRRPFLVLACRACGTHRILPRALQHQAAAENLYNEYVGPDVNDADRRKVAEKTLRRLNETGLRFYPGLKILDIGCGSGVLLEALCREYGCVGKGIDVDRRRIERARAHCSSATFECGLFAARDIKEPFDMVCSVAVIEHVVDPPAFLKEIGQILEPGGSLYLLTPNAASLNYRILRSWWRELLSIGEHIYLFTPASLEQCAKSAGFELIRARTDFDLSPLCRIRFDTAREVLISIWASYCGLVKRLCKCLASDLNADLLYAHFKKL
jgi:2-polyprenyl-3-methyl-5-hydroxy-6-metoxy-1,4-benzoquinol methylase